MTTWLPPETVSRLLPDQPTPRHVVRLAQRGAFGNNIRRRTRGRNGRAIEIALHALPEAARAAFLSSHPHHVRPSKSEELPPPIRSYREATQEQRDRADRRVAAVKAWQLFIAEWGSRRGITAAKDRWVEGYRLQHPIEHLSVASIERWASRFEAFGQDGLIDGNDGHARRGKPSIPRAALNFFLARYLDKDAPPTIARAIADTRLAADHYGWWLPEADDPFYRYVGRHVSPAVKLARRDAVDTPSTFLPYVQRGMDVPNRTLQSDHHIADVFVNCEGKVCADARVCRAHRPWWTPMYDVGSRKVIASQISLEVPNSERILLAFRRAVEAEGLPARFYIDNGKDFKKAAGKGLAASEEEFIGRRMRMLGVEVVFARPYNAQAKAIERFFGTFVSHHWRGSEGYTGALGKRSERTQELCAHPERLITFTAFAQLLEDRIAVYNHTPHRGTGMNGRTPAEVFATGRTARRDPDPFAFQLVFWQNQVRVLDRNGVRVAGFTYTPVDPDGRVHAAYLRKRVIVLINPANTSEAILCNRSEQFLCEARALELATHDTRDAITQAALDHVSSSRKAIRAALYGGDRESRMRLAEYKRIHPQLLHRVAERLRDEERQLVASMGAPTAATVVIPVASVTRRAMEAARSAVMRSSLTDADRELAASIPPITDEQLDRLLDEKRGYAPAAPLRAVRDIDDAGVTAELARAARRRKAKEGLCVVEGCEEPRTRVVDEADECGRHWLAANADEFDEETAANLRREIEREAH